MSITDWMELSNRVAHEHGFNAAEDIHRSLLLIVGEITEAQNELRAGHAPRELYWSGDKPEGFGVELADAVLRIFNLAADLGVDLERAISEKHCYNATRPFKHGGKAF